jgi:hypothetical protein
MMPRASPGDDEKEETTDYADYTDFFVFSSHPFMLHRVFAAYFHSSSPCHGVRSIWAPLAEGFPLVLNHFGAIASYKPNDYALLKSRVTYSYD